MEALVIKSAKGQDVTTSIKIAEVFGKRHDDVLKAIRNLQCSEEFTLRNFAETPCINPQNKQTYSVFEITKDGFAFLAMGFKGKKAAKFKEQFIDEFNKRGTIIQNAIEVAPKSQSELILMIAQQNVATEHRINEIQERIDLMSARINTSDPDYFAIKGFASYLKKPVDNLTASTLSKKAWAECQKLGYPRYEIPDPRFGKVLTYPKTVLETVFKNYYVNPGF